MPTCLQLGFQDLLFCLILWYKFIEKGEEYVTRYIHTQISSSCLSFSVPESWRGGSGPKDHYPHVSLSSESHLHAMKSSAAGRTPETNVSPIIIPSHLRGKLNYVRLLWAVRGNFGEDTSVGFRFNVPCVIDREAFLFFCPFPSFFLGPPPKNVGLLLLALPLLSSQAFLAFWPPPQEGGKRKGGRARAWSKRKEGSVHSYPEYIKEGRTPTPSNTHHKSVPEEATTEKHIPPKKNQRHEGIKPHRLPPPSFDPKTLFPYPYSPPIKTSSLWPSCPSWLWPSPPPSSSSSLAGPAQGSPPPPPAARRTRYA